MKGYGKRGDGYATSRVLYVIEALVENFISILTTGAFLATLTKALGINDGLTAILSSIVSLSSLFQIVTVFIAHKTPVKRWIIPMQLAAHLMLSGLYLIPIFNIKRGAGFLFFILIVGANALKQIISSARVNWFYSLVLPKRRGAFTSMLTAVSVIGQIFFSLGASALLDSFVAKGNQRGAFILLTVVIFVLIVLDIIPLLISKEKPESKGRAPSPFASMKAILKHPGYRTFLIITMVSAVATGITPPFLSTYQINELGFSLSFIARIDVLINVIWIASLLLFGQMSNTRSYAYIRRLAAAFHVLAFGILIFTTPNNGTVLFVGYRIFSIIQHSAQAVSTRGLVFELSTEKTRTGALAIQTMFTGVLSFITTLITRFFFDRLQKNHAVIFGQEMQAQQVLAVVSFVIIIVVNLLWWIFYKKINLAGRVSR